MQVFAVELLALTDAVMPGRHTADGDLRCAAAVEVDLIHLGVEGLVVRTEGIEDRPDHLEAFVVGQCLFRLDIRGHDDGDDDVAIFLFLLCASSEATHHPAYGLHHLHFRVAGREEEHGI